MEIYKAIFFLRVYGQLCYMLQFTVEQEIFANFDHRQIAWKSSQIFRMMKFLA